jgi:transposase-like protein
MDKKGMRRYPMGVKQRAVERMRLGENVSELAQELKVDRTTLYQWKWKLEAARGESEAGEDLRDYRIRELEAKIAGMEGTIGRQTLELDFFAGALRRIKESSQSSGGGGEKASTPRLPAARQRKAD